MATDDFKALLNSGVTLEALRKTQDSCGWLVAIADRSNDPDAQAATRWLEKLGERAYLLLDHAAGQAGSLLASSSGAQVSASATPYGGLQLCYQPASLRVMQSNEMFETQVTQATSWVNSQHLNSSEPQSGVGLSELVSRSPMALEFLPNASDRLGI